MRCVLVGWYGGSILMEFQRVKRSTNLDFMRASRADQMLNDATINVQQHIRYILLT